MDMPTFIVRDGKVERGDALATQTGEIPRNDLEGTILGSILSSTIPEARSSSTAEGGQTSNVERKGLGESSSDAPLLLQHLSHRHKAVAEFALQGRSIKDIARLVGFTTVRVSQLLNQPAFQHHIATMREQRAKDHRCETSLVMQEAREVIETATLQAAQTQLDLLGSKDEKVQLATSIDILNRAYGKDGLNPSGANRGSSIQLNITGSDSEAIMKRFLSAFSEAGLDREEIQDAEFTENEIPKTETSVDEA